MSKLTSGQALAWGLTALFAVLMIYRSIWIIATTDTTWFTWITGVLLIVLVVLSITLRTAFRERALRRAYPNAFVASIAAYDPLSTQIAASAQALGGDKSRFYPGYLSIVVDDKELLLVGGFFFGVFGKQKIRARLPLRGLKDVRVEKVAQGKWNLNTLEFDFDVDGQTAKLNFALLTVRFGLPLVLPIDALRVKVAGVEAAVSRSKA